MYVCMLVCMIIKNLTSLFYDKEISLYFTRKLSFIFYTEKNCIWILDFIYYWQFSMTTSQLYNFVISDSQNSAMWRHSLHSTRHRIAGGLSFSDKFVFYSQITVYFL